LVFITQWQTIPFAFKKGQKLLIKERNSLGYGKYLMITSNGSKQIREMNGEAAFIKIRPTHRVREVLISKYTPKKV
jgi:hypothetical protein